MVAIRRVLLRLVAFLRFDRADDELTRELDSHLRLLEDQFVARGMTGEDARVAARRAFAGQLEQVKARQRDARSFRWRDESWLDAKLGVRTLRKYPGLTVIAVVALSVAIGGGAAYLEFVNDAVRPTLQIPGGDRLVGIQQWDITTGEPDHRALHNFVAWRAGLTSVENLGAYRPMERNLITDDGRAEPVHGVEISTVAFRLVPTPPYLGRTLLEEDERPGATPVVVLGHALWQARFGADPAIVGRAVRLGSVPHTIVGVMPEGFGFPVNHSLWVPLSLDTTVQRGEGPAIRVFGRIKQGAALETVQSELTAIALRTDANAPDSNKRLRPQVRPYVESLWSSFKDGLLQMRILYGVNLFFVALLAVCGANVATLVFGRTVTREGEIALRTALGASRGRIVAQLFVEALVLSSLGAAVGLVIASYGLRWGKAAWLAGTTEGGAAPPFWWDDRLSVDTLLYAGLLTVLAALMVGVVPALKATGGTMALRLKTASAGGSSMKFGGVWTSVIMQIALTVIFLLTVVSLGWNYYANEYRGGDVAFARAQYLSARLQPDRKTPDPSSRDNDRLTNTFLELEQRLMAEPGVIGVTCGTAYPGLKHSEFFVEFQGIAPSVPAHGPLWVQSAAVAPDFLSSFNARMVAGRAFTPADANLNRPVAIVDQTFVETVLGGRSLSVNGCGSRRIRRIRVLAPGTRSWGSSPICRLRRRRRAKTPCCIAP